MNIIFYCQYVWGMGHLVRSLEFARALSDHDVTLIAGGQQVDMVERLGGKFTLERHVLYEGSSTSHPNSSIQEAQKSMPGDDGIDC